MARQKLNRKPLEQKIIEYIQEDRHPLEIFADRDCSYLRISFFVLLVAIIL